MKHSIVYSSPNGSTRHVARIIAERTLNLDESPELFDLGQRDVRQRLEKRLLTLPSPGCLWIGSPVYVDHMVPQVARFLQSLPEAQRGYAVPFVTWGGVNSGVALHEMGQLLALKGYALLGAAKVLAVHSSMWRSNQPLGAGHPDAADDSAVRGLVDAVLDKLTTGAMKPLPLADLDYQPEAIKEQARHKSIAVAKANYPQLAAAEDRCTQCGECAEKCPAQAIALNPYPEFGEECFMCLRCVRECPESAIPMDMAAAEVRLRAMALATNESPSIRIFT
jgi:ferredoxin